MANLGTRTKNINIVLRKNAELDINRIKDWCATNCERYAFIKHENDINLQDEVEGIHYHLVLVLLKATRLSTCLTSICDYLEINPFGVEIDKTSSLEGSIQYLIHKNDPQKTQHKLDEIIHNWPDNEMKSIIECDSSNGSLTFERILEICKTSKNLLEVIQSIGLGRYHLYRPVVMDIWKEVNNGKVRAEEYVELAKTYNNLLDTTTNFLATIMNGVSKTDKKFLQLDKWENEIKGRFYHV